MKREKKKYSEKGKMRTPKKDIQKRPKNRIDIEKPLKQNKTLEKGTESKVHKTQGEDNRR